MISPKEVKWNLDSGLSLKSYDRKIQVDSKRKNTDESNMFKENIKEMF